MLIGGSPVAVHEDEQVLLECARGTRASDAEVRGEERDISVVKLGGSRDPLVRRMNRASSENAGGNVEAAKEIMGWD